MIPRLPALPRPGPAWSILLLFLGYAMLALAVLGANPLKGESITPLDVLVKQRAWAWVDPSIEVRQPERTDAINALLPTWIIAREQLRGGRVPAWNDQYAGGNTLLAPSTGTYTPAFLVFAAAPTPALGFHLAIVFNLAMAGLGMHLFLRRRLSFAAALFGAITLVFCGFHAAWLYWAHVFTFMWAPWLLLAVDRCAERPDFRRALTVAAASALLILGGFPFVAELVFGMAALYFLVLWTRGRDQAGWRARFALWYAAGTGLGFLLCALPLLELFQFLQQYDFSYRDNRGSYLDISHMTRLLPPWAYEHKRVEQTMYVGLAMTLLAAGAAAATVVHWKHSRDLARFGVLLLAIMTVLVFGLVPVSWVAWFPGMGFNSWSRGIGVLGIALIVLGSIAIDHAWEWARSISSRRYRPAGSGLVVAIPSRGTALFYRRLLLAGVGLVIAVQTVEIATFFSRYNGPVSSSYFYPRTPATDYLREHAGLFDYIIADDSFHISGALGAYGLREWFGHQFRTPALKVALSEMVPDHFSSHTSSRFKAGDIRTDSPLMATMNVRYLAVASTDPHATGPGMTRHPARRPLPPLPSHHWEQRFTLEQPMLLDGISLRLATYRKSDLQGTVRLVLSDASGNPLAKASIDTEHLVDNAMADFYFPEPVTLAGGRHGFSLAYAPPAGSEPRRLTAWAAASPAPGTELLVDGAAAQGVIEYVLHPGTGARGPFRRVLTAAGISVYENTSSPGGPYFVGRLGDTPDSRSGQDVHIEQYAPTRFTLRYSGSGTGFVVVPVSMNNQWTVAVDAVATDVGSMLGVMPAVPVEGPATITFEYRPVASQWLAAWLALVLAALLSMWFVERRTVRNGPAGSPGALAP